MKVNFLSYTHYNIRRSPEGRRKGEACRDARTDGRCNNNNWGHWVLKQGESTAQVALVPGIALSGWGVGERSYVPSHYVVALLFD